MSGIRIQHPKVHRVTVLTVEDSDRPLRAPMVCVLCRLTHTFKTYHFRMDAAGATIVSREIAARVKAHPEWGFLITGVVANPPEQRLHVNGPATHPSVTRLE